MINLFISILVLFLNRSVSESLALLLLKIYQMWSEKIQIVLIIFNFRVGYIIFSAYFITLSIQLLLYSPFSSELQPQNILSITSGIISPVLFVKKEKMVALLNFDILLQVSSLSKCFHASSL